MRVLFKDNSDNTFRCCEVVDCFYDSEIHIMYFDIASSADSDYASIRVDKNTADLIMVALYERGMVDVRDYFAYFDDEPPAEDSPEQDTRLRSSSSSNRKSSIFK